jgi:DNA-binding MarR family transcriptional regulator/N-acetylglutamate synthase-like GNAT family acetyltransferase
MRAKPAQVEAVRRFSRFYTREIGLLEEGFLHTPFSLPEGRVIYEVAQHDGVTATELAAALSLDGGYLSRLLGNLRRKGIVRRTRSEEDRRRIVLTLTERGREAFRTLDEASRQEIRALLERLSEPDRARLVDALTTVRTLLGDEPAGGVPYILRDPGPGDLGWVVQRHASLYAEEYGWDETFEALVAEIVARFVRNFDPKRERCWIAEREGVNVGCVFTVAKSKTVAQLRCLLVDPSARGLGIGTRLVRECIRFARSRGYRKMTLWTNDILVSARRIYEAEGFHLVHQGPHEAFGKDDLVEQTWERAL